MSSKSKLGLAIAVIVAAKLAFYVYLATTNPVAFVQNDTPSYVDPLRSMMQEGRFYAYGRPEILRTPGYPLFLLPFARVFGEHRLHLSIVAHIGLTLLTAWIVVAMASCLCGESIPAWAKGLAMLIVLLDPASVAAEFALLSETLFTCVLAVGLCLMIRALRTSQRWLLLLAALILSLSAYIRPAALYLNYLLLAGIIVWGTLRKDFKIAGLALAGILLHYGLVSAWVQRNETLAGARFFSTASAYNLYGTIGASVMSKAERKPFMDMQTEMMAELAPTTPEEEHMFDAVGGGLVQVRMWKMGMHADIAAEAQRRALRLLAAHPWLTLNVFVKGTLANMIEPGTAPFAIMLQIRKQSGVVRRFLSTPFREFLPYVLKNELPLLLFLGAGAVWIVLLWIGFATGVAVRRSNSHIGDAILLAGVVYFLAIAAGPHSLARYRVPAVPFIALYAAVGAAYWIQRRGLKDVTDQRIIQ